MTPENFCYWLQGFFEISDADVIYSYELDVIKEHLELALSIDNNKQKYADNSIGSITLNQKDGYAQLPLKACHIKSTPLNSSVESTLLC